MTKAVRYTDTTRYPNGYRKSAETNIQLTFRRVREKLKIEAEQAARDEAERNEKLRPMRRASR